MASYRQFRTSVNVLVEQNIYSDNELLGFDAKMNINGVIKTAVLYSFELAGLRYYSLGLLENLKLNTVKLVKTNLEDVLKYKTARTRRKYIYDLIDKSECMIARGQL